MSLTKSRSFEGRAAELLTSHVLLHERLESPPCLRKCSDDQCKFAHGEEELRAGTPVLSSCEASKVSKEGHGS